MQSKCEARRSCYRPRYGCVLGWCCACYAQGRSCFACARRAQVAINCLTPSKDGCFALAIASVGCSCLGFCALVRTKHSTAKYKQLHPTDDWHDKQNTCFARPLDVTRDRDRAKHHGHGHVRSYFLSGVLFAPFFLPSHQVAYHARRFQLCANSLVACVAWLTIALHQVLLAWYAYCFARSTAKQ